MKKYRIRNGGRVQSRAWLVGVWLALNVLKCSGLETARSLEEFSYQTWQTENGLPQNTVRSILQSRDGYIWLGTEDGLVRFDGYRFEVFDSRNTPALASNDIRGLREDRAGALWIATGDGVTCRGGGQFRRYAAEAGLAFNSILSMGLDAEGAVWAIAPNGTARWHGDGFQSHPLPDGLPRLTGALVTGTGNGLLLGAQGGLVNFSGGSYTLLTQAENAGAVEALARDSAGTLWAGTRNGLFREEAGERHRLIPVPGLTGKPVTAVFADRENTVWAGTGGTLLRVAGNSAAHPVRSRSIPGDAVLAMTEDSEGNLWIGTESAGLTVLRNQKFVTYTSRDGLAGDNVRCVYSDKRGVTWIGTDHGLTRLEGGKFKQLGTGDGLASNVILSIAEDEAGDLYVGTPDGLNRISAAGGISVMTSADGLPDDFIRSVYCDRDGSLWLGTRRGAAHLEHGRIRTYGQSDGLESELIGTMLRDSSGALWIATLQGLSAWRGKQFETYRKSSELSSDVITALYEDTRANLWAGTQDGGLNVRLGAKFIPLPRALGLPEAIFGILEDRNGDLWMLAASGIVRANRDELISVAAGRSAGATVVWYGTSDGLRVAAYAGAGHPGVSKGADGTLWFATLKGAAALSAEEAQLNRVPPRVVMESVLIDDQTFAPDQVREISPGHRRIAFEYAGLSFTAPQKVRYRYRLQPFDRDWVDGGLRRTAFYTNIPPGRYRFEVMARNNDGFWSTTPAGLNLRLEPHFYQTYWFYSLSLALLGCAGYLIYRWRVAEVEARFNAVLQERNRIAREIHDTLAQGFVGVSVQLEIVSRLLGVSAQTAKEHLDQARVLVRESIGEARRSIWELRSHAEQPEDLPSRLSKTATNAVGNSPVKLSLQVRGAYRPLNRKVEDELLRIGQEAVMNALRHAQAERVEIELAFEAKALRMTVSDDGRGFTVRSDGSGPEGHFGLKGMRERAEQIGAKLTVDSAIGKGTRVFVEAPVT